MFHLIDLPIKPDNDGKNIPFIYQETVHDLTCQ